MQCVKWRDSGQVGGVAQPKEADGGFPKSWGITNLKEGATVKEVPGKEALNTMVLNVLSWVPCS